MSVHSQYLTPQRASMHCSSLSVTRCASVTALRTLSGEGARHLGDTSLRTLVAALGSVQSATAYSVGVMLRYGVCYVTAYSRVRVRDTANTSVRRNITRIVVFPPVRVKSRFDGLALYSRCGCRSSRARCVRAPCRVRAIAVRLRRLPTVAWSHAWQRLCGRCSFSGERPA